MADATDSKSVVRKGVWVQVPPPVFSFVNSFRKGITQYKRRTAQGFRAGSAPFCSASSVALRSLRLTTLTLLFSCIVLTSEVELADMEVLGPSTLPYSCGRACK